MFLIRDTQLTLISVRVPYSGHRMLRARARAWPSLPSRSLCRRCASRSPCGDGRPSPPRCCVCPPAALAGCRQYLRRQPPRRDAGRLRSVGLFARVDAARAAALARGPCAHRCGDERPSHRLAVLRNMPAGRPCGMPSVFAPPAPQAGCWTAPLCRPLCEGRRGPGRCSCSRPLRSSRR